MVHLLGSVDRELLGQCPLFKEMGAEELAAVVRISESRTFLPEALVYEEGSPGDSIWILLEGSVRVMSQGEELALRKTPGDTFGETGFFEGFTRSASLVAVMKTRFLVLPSARLWSLVHQNPEFGVKLLTQVGMRGGRKLRESSHRLLERIQKTPLTRYHRDPELINRPVEGTVFSFDLKLSELLMRSLPPHLEPNDILNRAIFPFRLLLVEQRGIEFKQMGDGVSAFFPHDLVSPGQVLTRVLPRFWRTLRNVSTFFEEDQIAPPGWALNFRVVIVYGTLKPIIQKLGHEEKPDWEEGREHPLTETARLMEIEKAIVDPEKKQTGVLFSRHFADVLARAPAGRSRLKGLGEVQREIAKHGREWEFFVQKLPKPLASLTGRYSRGFKKKIA